MAEYFENIFNKFGRKTNEGDLVFISDELNVASTIANFYFYFNIQINLAKYFRFQMMELTSLGSKCLKTESNKN